MKMICPKSGVCGHDTVNGRLGKHCVEHEHSKTCDYAVDDCPACVPVKEVKEPKKEKV